MDAVTLSATFNLKTVPSEMIRLPSTNSTKNIESTALYAENVYGNNPPARDPNLSHHTHSPLTT